MIIKHQAMHLNIFRFNIGNCNEIHGVCDYLEHKKRGQLRPLVGRISKKESRHQVDQGLHPEPQRHPLLLVAYRS